MIKKPMCITRRNGEKIHYSETNWESCSCGEIPNDDKDKPNASPEKVLRP